MPSANIASVDQANWRHHALQACPCKALSAYEMLHCTCSRRSAEVPVMHPLGVSSSVFDV